MKTYTINMQVYKYNTSYISTKYQNKTALKFKAGKINIIKPA